jgi:hypothetical protein
MTFKLLNNVESFKEFYAKSDPSQTFMFSELHSRQSVIDFITYKKSQGKFTVIDLGASAASWSYNYIDAAIDIHPVESKLTFNMDVQDQDQWGELREYVGEHGKFDFSICSHTIEDLHYPQAAIKLLQKISDRGYITTPSVYRELTHLGEGRGKGYDHHHWMYHNGKDNELVMIPKMNHIEHTDYALKSPIEFGEIQCLWNQEIKTKHAWTYPHTRISTLYAGLKFT